MNLDNTPFRLTNPRQLRIHKNLLRIGPGPASFYFDACRLMNTNPRFHATTHLVSHLLREIESSLRDVLKPFIDAEKERPKKKNETHVWEITEILKGLEIPDDNPVARAWLELPNSDYALHARAHREDLAAPRKFDDKFLEFWNEMDSILDFILDRFETRYLNSHKPLDTLLAKVEPTNDDAKWLRLNTPNNRITYGYFFDRLANPLWLPPLITEGLFKHPAEPEIEEREDGNVILYPPWPQSRYLARMAGVDHRLVQELVTEVMLGINTENFLIHLDILTVATKVPADLSAKLATKEIEWLEKQERIGHLLPEELGELISHLARGGQVDFSLKLARAVLTVLPNPDENERGPFSTEPRTRFDKWDYSRVVHKSAPVLAEHSNWATLELFCELLETAIYESHPDREITGTEDHSEYWRRGIDSDSDGLRNTLLTALRDTAELAIRSGAIPIDDIIGYLDSRTWLVFKRLALHLLRLFPEGAGSLISVHLTNRVNFEERELWHEYILLAKNHFSNLDIEQQETILGWIDESPGIEVVKENHRSLYGREVSDEEADKIIRWRKLQKLEPLRDVLPEEWKERYEAWSTELGKPENTEYSVPPVQFGMGHSSPRSSKELESLSIEGIVDYLKKWEPSEDPMGPSPEGLGQELLTVVKSKPEEFAESAELFTALDPTYVRALISGLKVAIDNSNTISWPAVLNLCDWVLNQPIEEKGKSEISYDRDIGWRETRWEIMQMLLTGLKADEGRIPPNLQRTLWDVLKQFFVDREPRTKDDEPGRSDPLERSLNSSRSERMRLLIQYANWVRQDIEKTEERAEWTGFEAVPEVREILEFYLDPANDSSTEIRAIYGEFLPGLIYLDRSWVQSNLSKILPKDEELKDLYETAWDTYLVSYNYIDYVVDLLEEEYFYAVQRINRDSLFDESHLTHPHKKLAEHVIVRYFRDKSDLDDPQSLISQFYSNASELIRSYVFISLGQYLEQTEKVENETLEKIQKLVDHRIEKVREASTDYGKTELKEFGSIFASGKLDLKWSMERLGEVLEISGYAELGNSVVEQLAELAADFPGSAVTSLEIMVEGVNDYWRIGYWAKWIRSILTEALKSEGRNTAIDMIHRLGARGHLEFQDLLTN